MLSIEWLDFLHRVAAWAYYPFCKCLALGQMLTLGVSIWNKYFRKGEHKMQSNLGVKELDVDSLGRRL